MSIPRAAGRAAEAFDRVMPRLALAVPHALRAIDLATRRGLVAVLIDAPRCLLGPFADRSIRREPGVFAPQCEGCPARNVCAGLDVRYLARFRGDEVAPRPGLSTTEGTPPAVTSWFVGAGELAVLPETAGDPARRSLPIAR